MKRHNPYTLKITLFTTTLILLSLACSLPFSNLPAQATPTRTASFSTPTLSPAVQPTQKSTGPNSAGPSQVPTQQNSQPSNTATIKLINNSGDSICSVNLTAAGAPSWGNDWLGADIVTAGGIYNFSVAVGNWDIRARDCNSVTLEETYNVVIPTSGLTWTVDAPVIDTSGSLTITNSASQTIMYAYLAPAGASYTNDVLGASTISPQGSYTISNLTPGLYCLKVESADQSIIKEVCDINVFPGASVIIDSNPIFVINGDVTIINNTGTEIFYIYISPVSSAEWGTDWLGANTLGAGGSVNFDIGTPGNFDVKLEDASHNVLFSAYNFWIGPGTVLTAS